MIIEMFVIIEMIPIKVCQGFLIIINVMMNLWILVTCISGATISSVKASGDLCLRVQLDPFILNSTTYKWDLTLIWNCHHGPVVAPFAFWKMGNKDLDSATVLNSISFQASAWICQNEPRCTFIMQIRSKLGQSTTCLGFSFYRS